MQYSDTAQECGLHKQHALLLRMRTYFPFDHMTYSQSTVAKKLR